MFKHLIATFTFTALACGPMVAFAQDYAEERAEAAQLGLLLYEFDSSAWVATDALRKKKSAWKLYTETAKSKGWVTTEAGDGRLMTAFVAELNGETVSVFDAITKGRKVRRKKTYPMGRALTDTETMQLWAKAALPLDKIEACRDLLPMNTIAIPTGNPDEVFVYLMSATQKSDLAVMGRHYRFRMTDGGSTISETVQFSNSCLALPTRGPKGSKSVGVFSTHLRTPHPQEHHVFASLSHDMKFFIGTSHTGVTWQVDGTKIEPIEMGTPNP